MLVRENSCSHVLCLLLFRYLGVQVLELCKMIDDSLHIGSLRVTMVLSMKYVGLGGKGKV